MQKYHYTGGGANRTVAEVEQLQKKYEVFKTDLIYDVFKKVLGIDVVSIKKPMNVGLPHATYVVSSKNYRDLVFRANLGTDEPEIQLVKEKLLADLSIKHGIPSNKIIHVDISRRDFPFDFQIQEVVRGEDAEIVFDGTNDDYDKYSFSLGQLVARLEEIKLPGFGHFNEDLFKDVKLVGESNSFYDYVNLELATQIQQIVDAGFLSTSVGDSVLELFESSKDLINIGKGGIVHYDLADHNLRYDKETFEVVAVYDWEAAVCGDSCLDLVSIPSWKTLYPREGKLLEGYLSLKSKPDYLEDKLSIYYLRTIIWKVVHNIKFDLVSPERIARLQKALDPFSLKMNQ